MPFRLGKNYVGDFMEPEIGIGTQRSLEELQAELEQQKREAMLKSRFRTIEPGKQAVLKFSGKVYERAAQINGVQTRKLDFELEEKTPEGTAKIFSVGSRSSTAAQLVYKLKEGKRMLSVSRKGSGTDTRYEVFEVEA